MSQNLHECFSVITRRQQPYCNRCITLRHQTSKLSLHAFIQSITILLAKLFPVSITTLSQTIGHLNASAVASPCAVMPLYFKQSRSRFRCIRLDAPQTTCSSHVWTKNARLFNNCRSSHNAIKSFVAIEYIPLSYYSVIIQFWISRRVILYPILFIMFLLLQEPLTTYSYVPAVAGATAGFHSTFHQCNILWFINSNANPGDNTG